MNLNKASNNVGTNQKVSQQKNALFICCIVDVGRCETEIVISWWDKAPRQTRTKISVSINFRKCLLAQSCIQNPFVPFSLSHLDNETVTNEMNERKKERLKGKRNGEIIFRLELKHFQFNELYWRHQ